MTLKEFVSKYTNQFVEVAGSGNALNQCVDLANAYIRDVLGLSIIEWTNACDFPSKAGDKYDYIENTPDGVPQRGDIIVWKPSPGHIAIFLDGDVNQFNSFDQNYPTGSKCHVQNHPTYYNVTGWLRAKKPLTPFEFFLDYQITGQDYVTVNIQDAPLDHNLDLGGTKGRSALRDWGIKGQQVVELQKTNHDLADTNNNLSAEIDQTRKDAKAIVDTALEDKSAAERILATTNVSLSETKTTLEDTQKLLETSKQAVVTLEKEVVTLKASTYANTEWPDMLALTIRKFLGRK